MSPNRLSIFALGGGALGILLACNLFDRGEPLDGCTKDIDCKGERICREARCVEPTTTGSSGEVPGGDRGEGERSEGTASPSSAGPGDKSRQCAEEGSFCELPDGTNGFCTKGACKSPCAPGLILYGGTHCAKPCRSPGDCPGGECSEGVCSPLCPPACPYKWAR